MVRPPAQPRKRRAAQQAPPAGVAKAEAGSGDRNVPANKRARAAEPSPLIHHDEDIYSIISGPPPLGLQLRKSPSFLDLIQTILSKAKSTSVEPVMENFISSPPMKNDIKSGALTTSERLKASNFPASFLKIGDWEYKSQYEGDLVAKCYYAKHKLVWEVLHAGLKSKIELQWSDIAALKATCPEDGDGTLDIVLSRPPIFFQETDPQPRKHTLWQPSSDFTSGQAIMYRRHILQCPSSLLSKNVDKIIQCDQRLYQLSCQPVVILDSPIFEDRSSIFENPNESDDSSPKFPHFASPCVTSSVFENDRTNPLMLKNSEPFSRPMNLGVVASDVQEKSRGLCNLSEPGLRSSMSMDDLVNHINSLPNSKVPVRELLQIAESLLSDTHGPPSADENFLMARVNSLCCVLEKDNVPTDVSSPENNDTSNVAEPDSDDTDGVVLPVISRKDSYADLMANLPRITSVPHLLFDVAEDFEN